MKNRLLLITFVFILFLVLSVSIGYSAFNTSLSISGDAFVRTNADVRITNLELVSLENGAFELYNSEFSRNLTTFHINLPNTSSSAKYRVDVTNNTSSYFTPGDIVEYIKNNSNIKCELSNIVSNGVYQGNKYSFYITFVTSSDNQSDNITISYNFSSISTNVWNFDYSGGEQTFPIVYSSIYKLEVWGAQGGDANGKIGGYGAYAVGKIELSKNDNLLYINVGGSGTGNLVTQNGIGGYNGGGNSVLYPGDDWNYTASGGGATHIAKKSGVLANLESFKGSYSSTTGTYDSDVILIVAGGGGGAYWHTYGENYAANGGNGGGSSGTNQPNSNTSYVVAGFGTQSSGGSAGSSGAAGSFGKGGSSSTYSSGGGGGFYGGGAAHHKGTGGGSGFIGNPQLIDKAMYCVGCVKTDGVHVKTEVASSASSSPVEKIGKKENGYARITLIPLN